MKQNRAVEAFTRLSTVLNLLNAHPAGLRLDYLADEVGVPEVRLRQEILDFYAADTLGVRPDTILFFSPSGAEADPAEADMVRVVCDQPSAELGVELLSAQAWLEVYQTVEQVAQMMPEDKNLAEAVDVIADRILTGVPGHPDTALGAVIAKGINEHRLLQMEYSRAWKPGVNEYVVRPLRLVQTRRGWEMDALVPDDDVRTFILDRIRSATLTDDTFEVPDGIDALLATTRAVTEVRLVVPLRYQWVVDRYAERTEVTEQDEEAVAITAEFLPPVAERVGLILVTAPDSFVVSPKGLDDAGPDMARILLEHHGL